MPFFILNLVLINYFTLIFTYFSSIRVNLLTRLLCLDSTLAHLLLFFKALLNIVLHFQGYFVALNFLLLSFSLYKFIQRQLKVLIGLKFPTRSQGIAIRLASPFLGARWRIRRGMVFAR